MRNEQPSVTTITPIPPRADPLSSYKQAGNCPGENAFHLHSKKLARTIIRTVTFDNIESSEHR